MVDSRPSATDGQRLLRVPKPPTAAEQAIIQRQEPTQKKTLAARITFTPAAATNGPATLIARRSSEALSRHGNPATCRCPLHAFVAFFIHADTASHRPTQACRRSPAWGSSGLESTASHRS